MKTNKISAIGVLLLSFFILQGSVQAKYSGGSGTAGAPYKIGSAANLMALATDTNDYNKYFVLTADINLSSHNFTTAVIAPDTNNTNPPFDGVHFTGSFNGAGHKIIGLTIDDNGVGNDYSGLFGYVSGGTIKNLGLEDVSITGGDNSQYLGGLVGYNDDSNISNCYSTGTISGGDNSTDLGGLVGDNAGGTISNCHSTGIITGGDNSIDLGGLVGYNEGGTVSNCYSTGTVTGRDNSRLLGGLVGYNENDTVSSCYSTGTVAGGQWSYYLGGLAGYTYRSNISDCYSEGAVTSEDNSYDIGGLAGYNGRGIINNCHSTGAVTGEANSYELGGLVGYNESDSNISNCYSKSTVTGGDNSFKLGGLVGKNYSSTIGNCYSTGTIIGGRFYVGGLAGCNGSGIISDCHSRGAVTAGDNSSPLGGLVGYNYDSGTISNCYSTGAVIGGDNSDNLGGLVGNNESDSNISNCYSTSAVAGGDNSVKLGGLVGYNERDLSNCYSIGIVTGGNGSQCLGGLVGINEDSISNCYSRGDVNSGNSSHYLGGLVGYNDTGDVNNCYSTGAVTGGAGTSNFGGLAGKNSGSINACYFLDTEPNNELGTPLTNAQMKQQSNFVGWDFIGEMANGTKNIWTIRESLDYPMLASLREGLVQVNKCTVTAGSKADSDKISFSGTMDANAGEVSAASAIKVIIDSNDTVSLCVQSFSISDKTFKKDKYSYSGTENGVKKSFTYDVKTHKFAFSASKVDLSGLSCPLTVQIGIGGYHNAGTEVNEATVNGPTIPIPIKLMTGVKNVLRVDKCQVKQNTKKPNSDQLTASGAFAVENPDPNMANWTTENLVITLGSQQFTVPQGSLKPGKGKFSCSKAKTTDPNATASATFNFNLCSFTVTIRDANIPDDISGDVEFGAAFADFDEVDYVTLP